MAASGKLSTTLPYGIDFAITRSQDDSDQRSIIFRWSPFATSGFVLLRHSVNGIEEVYVDHSRVIRLAEEDTVLVNGYNQYLWELPPGGKVEFRATLPERYQRQLVPDSRYELLWPGGNIVIWEWGTIPEHLNQELKAISTKEHALVLPGGPHVSFTAKIETHPWPMRLERETIVGYAKANFEEEHWRLAQRPVPSSHIQSSERHPGTPILNVTLECPSTVSRDDSFDILVKVTYQGGSSRPIVFHTYTFEAPPSSPREGFHLYRRRDDGWEECEIDEDSCFRIVDDPDIVVSVGEDANFTSLAPGESWVTSRQLQGHSWTDFPGNVMEGDVFRYQFNGIGAVDWWDWGNNEEHKTTKVKLPCWISGSVTDPADNGGRPKLVVPASEAVEFSFVG